MPKKKSFYTGQDINKKLAGVEVETELTNSKIDSSNQNTNSQEAASALPPKNVKKKYLRLDITNYQDYISLMADHKTNTSGEYVSMTQYILRLIEADKQKNIKIYEKLKEIENLKQNIV